MAKAKKSYEAMRNELLSKALAMPLDHQSIQNIAEELDTNPKYSLEVDPTGQLGMSSMEKEFTKWYLQHRNIAVAAQISDMSIEDGMKIYKSFACQAELRRIDMAWKLRQLNTSTLSLDQIGGVLTSYVFDQMPDVDRLSTKDKMTAMKMIMDIHALKQKVVEEATPVDAVDVESQVKELSVDALKALIERTKSIDKEVDEKEDMIKNIDDESMLSNEDLQYLRSLSVDELKKLLAEQELVKANMPVKKEKTLSIHTDNLTPLDESDYVHADDITGS